jgi:hypothetical protein
VLGFVLRSSAFLLLCAPHVGCGDDDKGVADAGGGSGSDGGGSDLFTYHGTLVSIFATDPSGAVGIPHLLEQLDNDTGAPLVPPVTTMSAAVTGVITFTGPKGKHLTYVHGTGVGNDSTVDTVIANADPSDIDDPLIRISTKGLSGVAEGSADYKAMPDRAGLTGAVYWLLDHKRRGTVGCAKVYIDGATGPDLDQAQRYNAPSGLPVPLTAQSETAAGGVFYFGNAKEGKHTLKVSLDDGKTFPGGETTVFIPFSNSEAMSDQKGVLVQMALYIEAPTNPTLSTCAAK